MRPVPVHARLLAARAAAIRTQASDAPGYDAADTLFPFGFGPSFGAVPATGRVGPAARTGR